MAAAAVSTERRQALGTALRECASAPKLWAARSSPARRPKAAFALKPDYR